MVQDQMLNEISKSVLKPLRRTMFARELMYDIVTLLVDCFCLHQTLTVQRSAGPTAPNNTACRFTYLTCSNMNKQNFG